jgi:DNA-binding MarR family transcriptional regulator
LNKNIPIGTRTLILSKLYYGILSKKLENLDTERYYSVLLYIYNNKGKCCQQDICDSLYVDKTAMVKILDHLSKKGLIERKVNPNDRRQHYVTLSKKGEKQSQEIAKTFTTVDEFLFKDVSARDKAQFNLVLEQLIDNLEEVPKNKLFFNYKKTK